MQDPEINRRMFLQGAAALGGAILFSASGHAAPPVKSTVKTVYVVFKCHLDIGFTGTQTDVLRRYYDHYIPDAMARAADLRAAGGMERYVWTVGSWLMWEYLAQATHAQQVRAAQAIADGDLAWHGIPFNWETEMVDPSLLAAGLDLSAALDKRFRTRTTGAKLTDVPGQTRSLVGPLARAGVTLLDIGVNPASSPPDVPALFRWRDPAGHEIVTLYHHSDYGGTVAVPGGDLAVSVQVRSDNSGVHPLDEIKTIYADLAREFPGAQIKAATLNQVAAALEPYRTALPVVTAEIGDTWVHGCASDPVKISRYRELCRQRREWLADGTLKAGSAEDRAWVPSLLLAPEHTWGCDVKTTLGDWSIYTPAELKAARAKDNFQKVAATWAEKRANNDAAASALPPGLAAKARARLETLTPRAPSLKGLSPLTPGLEIKTKHFVLALDPISGAICRLKERKTGREWASAVHPLGLFAYQTFSNADYKRFLEQYVTIHDWWPPQDFGKPGLDKYPALSRTWLPASHESYFGRDAHGERVVSTFTMPDPGASAPDVAWPERLTMTLTLPDDDPAMHLNLQWFGKAANRLPEALWLSFVPLAEAPDGWRFDKSGQAVNPRDVVSKGARSVHAVTDGASYHDAHGSLHLETWDAPVIAAGRRTLLDFDDRLPDMTGGVHVNLYNNTWGTNYPQWLGDDLRFRFVLRV